MADDSFVYMGDNTIKRVQLIVQIRRLRDKGTPEALKEADEKQAELNQMHRDLKELEKLEQDGLVAST